MPEQSFTLSDIAIEIFDRVNYLRSELIKYRKSCEDLERINNGLRIKLREYQEEQAKQKEHNG